MLDSERAIQENVRLPIFLSYLPVSKQFMHSKKMDCLKRTGRTIISVHSFPAGSRDADLIEGYECYYWA